MIDRVGPIVIFKCNFCGEEYESPWVYSPWPPVDMEEYEAWKEMVSNYEEDSRVDSVCYKCQKLGLGLEMLGCKQKNYPLLERV